MSTVDEVKARLDIVDVIGGYVRLQKAGRYFKANCPFHNEKTPSFYVYPDRQSWHCFGACGTGGDVIAFMSRKENLDFSATLRLLADRAGVELRSDGPRREEIKTLQDANEAAALYFHSLLANSAAARAYVEQRGLDQQAVGDFQLGFAPRGWDNLRNHLKGKGFAEAQLVEAGLLIEGDRGPYDRFRERLMFPIRDERGRVVGFGGRVLPGSGDDAGAKYLNTPQTPIFDKGGVLYAFDRAKEQIRSSGAAVIVEGYMDVIAAHQHGFRNVVASMGTALTDRQALLLQRQAGRIVLAMDADEAGSAANLRAVQVVAAAAQRPGRDGKPKELEIRVLALPRGKDPDELIRSEPAAWQQAVEAAQPVIDHYYRMARANRDMADPRQRQELIDEMLPLIGELTSSVEQATWIQRIAGGRAREDELWRQIRRRRVARPRAPAPRGENDGDTASTTAASAAPRRSAGEEYALALLYQRPAVSQHALSVPQDLFGLSENRELFRRWLDGETVTEGESELWEHYQDVLQIRLPELETAQAEAAFLDCVKRLQQARMKAVKEASALALAEEEAGVRPGQVASLARARLEAGNSEDATQDAPAEAAASRLLEDMEAGLRFHRRLIEGSRTDQAGRSSR